MTKTHDRKQGFRENKSTESAIAETVNYIKKDMENNEDVIGVFLDIQAAFDTIGASTFWSLGCYGMLAGSKKMLLS